MLNAFCVLGIMLDDFQILFYNSLRILVAFRTYLWRHWGTEKISLSKLLESGVIIHLFFLKSKNALYHNTQICSVTKFLSFPPSLPSFLPSSLPSFLPSFLPACLPSFHINEVRGVQPYCLGVIRGFTLPSCCDVWQVTLSLYTSGVVLVWFGLVFFFFFSFNLSDGDNSLIVYLTGIVRIEWVKW